MAVVPPVVEDVDEVELVEFEEDAEEVGVGVLEVGVAGLSSFRGA